MTASNPMLERIAEMTARRTALLDEVKHIDTDMVTLRRTMDIMDGKPSRSVSPTRSEPKGKRQYQRSVLAPDDLPRAVLEVLRDAPKPMTTTEVGKLALVHFGLPARGHHKLNALGARPTSALRTFAKRRTLGLTTSNTNKLRRLKRI